MSKLAVLGAGGHGRVIADAALCAGWQALEFFDDAWPSLVSSGAWSVVGSIADYFSKSSDYGGVVVGVGANKIRAAILEQLAQARAPVVSIVHPAATVSAYATLGRGSVVFAGAILNVGAKVGVGAIINTASSVDHDCELGEAVHISPGAHLGGAVRVGDFSWVGVGACVRQQITIGEQVMVGAGAVVVADIPDNVTVVGNPALPIRGR